MFDLSTYQFEEVAQRYTTVTNSINMFYWW